MFTSIDRKDNIQTIVYTQYFGTKKPLDGLAHYINIGTQMRE